MLSALDHALMRELYAGSAAGTFGRFMLAVTWAGGGWAMLGLLPLLVTRRTRRFGLALLGTLLTSATIVFSLKAIVRRPRPYLAIDGIVPLSGSPTDFSFPSGHAMGSATFATFVLVVSLAALRSGEIPRRLRPGVVLACLTVVAFAGLVAASRVYLGVHYPGDVTAGALLGACVGTTGALLYRRAIRRPSKDEPSAPDVETRAG